MKPTRKMLLKAIKNRFTGSAYNNMPDKYKIKIDLKTGKMIKDNGI